MTNYLIVVPRGNTELFELLSVAFRGHTGFNVVIDRRGSDAPAVSGAHPAGLFSQGDTDAPYAPSPGVDDERRGGRVLLGPDEIVVAERAEWADRPVTGGEPRSYPRIPVRRRRARRSTARTGSVSPRPERHDAPAGGGASAC